METIKPVLKNIISESPSRRNQWGQVLYCNISLRYDSLMARPLRIESNDSSQLAAG
jgi:hypothetical protein